MRRFLLTVGVVISLWFSSFCWAGTSTTAAPEFDLYLTHNEILGSRFMGFMNYQDTTKEWTTGYFEYTVDVGLEPFFRRYVYKDPNVEKTKRVLIRGGYAYFPDFTENEGTFNEHRALMELTFRIPIRKAWLWTDQNKGEVRFFDNQTSTRYRNRMKLERAMKIAKIRATPYVVAEGFYDIPTNRWNRLLTTFGIEFPWKYSVVFEPSYTHTVVYQGPPAETIGFAIQKHLAMPIGLGQ